MKLACEYDVATGTRSCDGVGRLLSHHSIINPIQTLP
jgi:hypothetical protein